MRYLNRLAWALVVVTITAASGNAQQQTTGGTNTGQLGGTTTGGGQQTGQGGQGGSTSPQLQSTQLQQMEAPPDISAPASTGSGLSASNILGGWYADPRFQGSNWDSSKTATPGGFGQALNGGAGGTSRTGAGGRTGTTGQTGRLGTQSRLGQNSTSQSGTVIPMQVNIAYPAVPRFPVTPLAQTQVHTDVTGMLSRSTSLLPGAANVEVITNGNTVTLRGTVSDLEEARTLEGMTRLTPGVRMVKNELTFPVSR